MGFRSNTYCTVWEVTPVSATMTKARVSISRKNRNTGEYETDFSGFVAFVGQQAASKALSLKEKDRIRLGDVDVTNTYNKEKNVTYTNFKVFNFDLANDINTIPSGSNNTAAIQEGDMSWMEVPETETPW